MLSAAPLKAADLETVVVTAGPPTPLGTAVFSSTTLDAAALRKADRLDSALAQVPGLSLFRRNASLSANPTTQGVSLRSIAPSGAGRALVTLDGVPQNDPFGGWVIWSALPPEDIASATIVRGAGAGPYGAGALTGVIALGEETDTALAASASWGERGTGHASAAGGASLDTVNLFASAAIDSSAGWIPVSPAQRGPADVPVTLNARSASLRAQTTVLGDTLLSARFGVYDEARRSGLGSTASEASGLSTSVTLAAPGWRLQGWLRSSDLQNSSASVSADRAVATPANNQYATPAIGWGLNAALRGARDWLEWELGADARFARGNSREQFSAVAGSFTQGRISGGKTSVAGIYAEGASHLGALLLTLGLRADRWESSNGHLFQTVLSSGATATTLYPAKHGIVPTARGGARYTLSENLYVRSAAYAGFRAPTLNELYRPFRLGNTTTAANPDLTPEKYYGVELGAGGTIGDFSWDGDIFFNQLHAAITNVTIGPNAFQRRNAGNINATGVEASARYPLDKHLTLRAAFNLSDAHAHSLRPAQAPRWTVTAGLEATPLARLTLSADLHYESNRFADDQNTLPLGPATTVDARIAYRLNDQVSLFVAADNLFNAAIATTASAAPTPVLSFDAPRMLRFGVTLLR
ncbi:MAG TPA: TonB-dependent receptor [Rhizomicrobium sp.]|nr:TonB-dependent receptor [Rhizomicrobium sp.]